MVFTQEVSAQRHRLQQLSLSDLERQVAAKRIKWLRENVEPPVRPVAAGKVFKALFFQYMGLRTEDLQIVTESPDAISWRSLNACPTLDACCELGLDSRTVCRRAYEKSTQVFASYFDPSLRFIRDYDKIRPHADHCLESLVRVDFDQMMSVAIEEAWLSRRSGNKGYGAVVVLGNEIVARAHDTATQDRDPSLHAELLAIRSAVKRRGDPDLTGAMLFSTCEPCPMCSSLAVWANVTTIAFGASIEATAALGKSRILMSTQEIIARAPAMVEVLPGVLEAECMQLYE